MEHESQEQNQHGDRKPIRREEKQKEFITAGQLKEVITNPTQMYETIHQYSNTIKKVANQHIKNKNLTVIDFSMNARGPDEDKMYVKHPFFRHNIRRGNTVVYDKDKKEAHWGRKGLQKFFDISQPSLEAIVNEDINSLSKKDQYNHYAIFPQIENALSCNDELEEKDRAKCHVYRLNKANGENAQISYFKLTDEWVVSSKNVSIFVKTQEDIKKYDGDRYSFAKLMAVTWFNILKEKNKNEIEDLKKALIGKTIIGEYCGNPDFQHLVKYADTTIYFYALVENESVYTCIPPPEAFRFFEDYKIPIVKNHEKSFFGKYTNLPELGKALLKLFSEVACSSIFEDEEGSVVYFVLEKPKVFCEFISDRYLQKTVPIPANWQTKEAWWNVSSLGKMKTLEYRILRKLREKLKFFTRTKKGTNETVEKKQNDNKKFQEKYGSFEKECYQLLRNQKLNKPIEYYFCIALVAFDYVFKNRKSSKNCELLNDHFLDFLSVIFWCVENKKEVTPAAMTEWKLIEELRGQTWEKYSIEVVNDYEKMLEQIVPRYAFIKRKMKMGQADEVEMKEKEEGDDDIEDDE